jgi:Cu(I)/Ag(I) efflux system membrane protein CusA/SilA
LLAAAGTIAPTVLTSLVIGALSFVPVFAFGGETGRLLRPLAFTKTLVVGAAALVSVTLAPALRARLLGGRVVPELHNPLVRALVRAYRPLVNLVLRRPLLTLMTAGLAVLSCLPLLPRIGGEFLPRLDEGSLLYMPTTAPGASMMEAGAQLTLQDRLIAARPEVSVVLGKVGRADSATDPAPASMAETIVELKPRAEWPELRRTRWYSTSAPSALKPLLGWLWPETTEPAPDEVVTLLDRATRLPGWTNTWTAPARARLDMMSTEIHTPLGIRITAGSPARVDELGTALQSFAAGLPDTRSASYESSGSETSLRFTVDPAAVSRLRADGALVQATADLLISGGEIGLVARDRRPIRLRLVPDIVVRAPEEWLRDATVRAPSGSEGYPMALGLLGHPATVLQPATVRTEAGRYYGYVYLDIADGTDLLRYVAQAERALAPALAAGHPALREGEAIDWTGQYRLLVAGQRRLAVIVPIILVSMVGLLWLQFRSVVESLIVLASVPFALVGSFWTLFLVGYRLSAPVWVGLLSTLALALQTGVVMVVYIDEAFYRRLREGRISSREDIVSAHAEGTVRRLRPKLMTVATMAAGLLPLLWSSGAGAEIMRRVAAPMAGGLASSAFLTLEVIPVLYTMWRSRQLRRAQRFGVPLDVVIGEPPRWARL